jgi:hypothetical protein
MTGGEVSGLARGQIQYLHLIWREVNGPAIVTPSKQGGSVLVESTLSSLDGKIDRDWSGQGMIAVDDATSVPLSRPHRRACEIRSPLSRSSSRSDRSLSKD